jgi:hypothetical protein
MDKTRERRKSSRKTPQTKKALFPRGRRPLKPGSNRLIFFAKPRQKEVLDFIAGVPGILALENDGEFGTVTGGQGHQVQEALAVHRFQCPLYEDPAFEFAGCLDELGGRPQMKPETVENLDFLGDFHAHLLVKQFRVVSRKNFSPEKDSGVNRWAMKKFKEWPILPPGMKGDLGFQKI